MPFTSSVSNLFTSNSDVIVIPHNNDGSLSSFFKDIDPIAYAALIDLIPKFAQLGDVSLAKPPSPFPATCKHIAFVCTMESGKTTYAAIRKIAIRLIKKLAVDFYSASSRNIALPVLGTDNAQLSFVDSCKIFFAVCKETALANLEPTLIFHVQSAEWKKYLSNPYALNIDASAIQETFRCSVLAAKQNTWVAQLAVDEEFYFSLAVNKYQEYLDFKFSSPAGATSITNEFIRADTTFQLFLHQYVEGSEEYRFLQLCGELVAYIDRNAYNKNLWNQYPDKRTMARSSVRQTNWIRNLLAYKENTSALNSLPPSIANAIRYLQSPADNLTMLSDNHRRSLYRKIFSIEIGSETSTLLILFKYIKQLGIHVKNPLNTGALYSRILYLPEIKELWLDGPDDEIPEPTDLVAEDQVPYLPGQPEQPENPGKEFVGRDRSIEATIHSDLFSDEDLLNYNSYARSISRFLTHKNTKPPLTVGILAPWGKGKTTLMAMIQKNIKEIYHHSKTGPTTDNDEKTPVTTNADFIKYLKTGVKELLTVQQLKFPTIWFNAWNFQKNEQVWAGFAHEIIHQLIGQLPTAVQQEKAWLALHLRRIDRQQLRSRVHRKIFNQVIPLIAVMLLCLLIIPIFSAKIQGALPYLFTTIPLLSAAGCWAVIRRFRSLHLDFDLYKYIRQPHYEDRLGYLHMVKEDLRLALDLLVDKKSPAIIFIDDLDRCSPSTTTDLVEAINAFISGDLPYCYFVLGQDAQMVAASLDVSYKDIGDRLGNLQNGYGSLGWFFMEKFMQLEFNIPIMQKPDSQRIMRSLLSYDDNEDPNVEQASVMEITGKADQLLDQIDSSDNELALHAQVNSIEEQLLKVQPEKLALIKNKIVDKAASSYSDEDSEVTNLIEEFAIHLTTSPRMVKRFVNLYRFHRFIQFTGQNKEMINTDARCIAKWIIIMIKWPQLVRAIQWDAEKDFQNGSSSADRAENFEQEIVKCTTYDSWRAAGQEKYKNGSAWLTDKGLYDFLKINFTTESSLKSAVDRRFW